jgi:MFS transporter, OFA family, oxalate/formate antiporter
MVERARIYYGWVVVTACFLGSFVVFGLSYSFGVFFEPILLEFGYPRGVTSVAFGIQSLMLYLGAVGIGILIDWYGTRRMLMVGTVILVFGLLGTSQAQSLPVFVIMYGIVTGLGMSIIFVVSYATVPRWFDRRQGFAGGLASAGLGMGMVVVAPAADTLIGHFGWRSALILLTACVVALLIVIITVIRDEPTAEQVPSHEFDGGFHGSERVELREQLANIGTIARSTSFVALFAGWILIYTTLYVVLSHLVVHIVDLGFSRTIGATIVALIGGASVVGRIGIGYVADQVGRVWTFVVCSAGMGFSTLALPALDTALMLVLFGAVYGLAYGGNGALLAPLTADLFGRENINAVFGLMSMSLGISGLLSPYIAGMGYDTLSTYTPAFVAAGMAALVGAGAIAVAGHSQGQIVLSEG